MGRRRGVTTNRHKYQLHPRDLPQDQGHDDERFAYRYSSVDLRHTLSQEWTVYSTSNPIEVSEDVGFQDSYTYTTEKGEISMIQVGVESHGAIETREIKSSIHVCDHSSCYSDLFPMCSFI